MNRKRSILLVVVLVVLLTAAGIWLWQRRSEPPPDRILASGTVEATDARLGFEIAGRITSVRPREGDTVMAGDALAEIDRDELVSRREEARAQLASAEARLAELEAGFRSEEIAQARASVAAARDRLADAERDLERTRTLLEGGAVPEEALDKAELGRQVAAAQLDQAEQQLRLLERGHRPEQVAAARGQVEAARATVQSLAARIEKTTLLAPFAGVVTVRHREPGEVVASGIPVLTLLDRDDRWVRIYVREDRIGALRLGQRAEIRSDSDPGRAHPGEVTFIASEAEFTPKDVQTREERVRLVYAVKVRVLEDPDYALKPGMPVDVEIPLDGGSDRAAEKG